MANEERLIHADEARREILREAPQLAYIIDRIKPVDAVEVVHGRWVEDRWTKWQCDKCHSPSPAYGYPRMEYVKTRYCPNCGAKMDGDGNE